jgi:hypothetical protein
MLGVFATAFVSSCVAILALNLTTPPREISLLLPTSTPTRRPPPTITPVAYPPTPPAVLADDFSGEDHFPRTIGVELPFGYKDKAYRLTPPLQPGFVRVLNQSFDEDAYRNLTLEARAAAVEDSSPIEYGLLFWHGEDEQGRENFIAFTVKTDSTFRLLAFEPVTSAEQTNIYQVTEIIPATSSDDIRVDGSSNLLRVDVHPRRILAYVNEELVIDTNAGIINDWRLARDWDGRVGIVAFAREEGAEVLFTQFDIYADVTPPPTSP